MESIIKLQNQYNSLDTLQTFLKNETNFECLKEYDVWQYTTDNNEQMTQCLVLKKNAMHAVKIHFNNENSVTVNHIIPSKILNAYFGKSQKRRQTIIEVITDKIKATLLANSQNKAFKELEKIVKKASSTIIVV